MCMKKTDRIAQKRYKHILCAKLQKNDKVKMLTPDKILEKAYNENEKTLNRFVRISQ